VSGEDDSATARVDLPALAQSVFTVHKDNLYLYRAFTTELGRSATAGGHAP
jgi:hypothetical protein